MSKLFDHLKFKRKKSSKNLSNDNAKRLLQTVFDTTNQGIAVFRTIYDNNGSIKDFRFIKVNKVLKEMYLNMDPLGKTYLETSKYGVELGIFDALKTVMKTGNPMEEEFHFQKEGYNNWFRMTVKSQDNLLIATIEDITARKRESEHLQETLRFKNQLEQTSLETILIINLDSYNVRYINKDIFPDAGMTVERIQGTPLTEIVPFIHPQDREKIIDFHKNLVKSDDQDVLEIEVRLKLRGASWEWFSVRGKIFKRRDANWVSEYVLLVRNITEQKNTQYDLLKAERLSIQGEVARIFAHELRNPLASIGMAADILNKKFTPGKEEQVGNYIGIISRSTKTLNNLVNNLLDSSNYSLSELKRENLAEILDQTLERASDRIYLAGITVRKNYAPNCYILADKEKLIIALLNIIVNASEATTPEKGIIEIEIKQNTTDCILSIRDNGHGLKPDEINRIFDAFYTNKNTGVGVGLTSVKNILEEHGAQINVDSKPKEGTCFRITFHTADS
ncbi:ATP-binding protein [Christiangramia sp.]|uniref:ATP-binding protein n=1 Tax=Christiangramia sp. TaxID=1931228 RepID=UPI002604257F|nr:ATP-binding protein [Christiangramia sp.]